LENGPFSVHDFPPLVYTYMMTPISYIYSWLVGITHTTAIPMSSLPQNLNFYPDFNVHYVPGWLFNVVIKSPFFISDVIITFLIYKIIKVHFNNNGLAEKAALLWFLNPFVIWISSGWGIWDTLPALLSLSAFYFILQKRYAVSAVFISLGVACKLYPLLFVVPILIYIQKNSQVRRRQKNLLTFIFAFLSSILILFLPYLNTVISFFSNYFLPTTIAQTSSLVTDQVNSPLGFGLTYWSLFLLNRLFNFPVSSNIISLGSILSVLLFLAGLSIIYWKIAKSSFDNQPYNLALILTLPLAVLFLTYRIICEQFFIWLIPFFIILIISGRIKPILYWSMSLIALLYATLNCPFPFFFLPLAPLGTNTLLGAANFMLSNETLRLSILSFLGCAFSFLLLIVVYRASLKR
jgi:hypothetical protein